MDKIYTIIIAAGKGTRMKSMHSKLIQKIYDKEMVRRVAETAYNAGSDEIIAVIGHKKEEVIDALKKTNLNISYAEQKELLGTGHAVMQAMPLLENKSGKVIVLYGDVPIIREETIKKIVEKNISSKEAVTVLTAIYDNPSGYGRIIRDEGGSVKEIKEEKDATDEERKIKEINGGIYCFDLNILREILGELKPNNAQNEYYLTDAIKLINDRGLRTGAYTVIDNTEILGVNDRIQLELLTQILRKRINYEHMLKGVTIEDISSTYIYDNVEIGMDTIIKPNVTIKQNVKIGENCIIGSNVYISENTEIPSGEVIEDYTKI